MVGQKNLSKALLALAALYAVWGLSFGSFLFVVLVAAVVHMTTKSVVLALVFATVIAFAQNEKFQRMFWDTRAEQAKQNLALLKASALSGMEGFQARDPESISQRIEMSRGPAPFAPKIASPTGVLESPDILNNVPLQPIEELMADGQPGASIPASAKARVMIYPPAEGFVPAAGLSQEVAPMVNPYLQNGEDHEGVNTALIPKGTDMPSPDVAPTEMASMGPASAPAF